MNEAEFLEAMITRMGGSFVEVAPNHYRISRVPYATAKKWIERFGKECLIEYVEFETDGA